MTLKQAIEAGYTHFGYANRDWQPIVELSELTDEQYDSDLRLFAKEFRQPSISAESIKEILADNMESDWGDDTSDDTNQVYDEVNKLDFESTSQMINTALSHIKAFKLTKIKLVREVAP